jgi:hypothetical protein
MAKSTTTSITSALITARNEAFCSGVEVLDLLEDCDASTTWSGTISRWLETAAGGDDLGVGIDDLSLLLLAIERLVDSRLRAARTQRAPGQIEMLESMIRPESEPSGTATALRFLLSVRRLTLLMHPEKGPGIIRAAEICNPAEAIRLWHEMQEPAQRAAPEGATLN